MKTVIRVLVLLKKTLLKRPTDELRFETLLSIPCFIQASHHVICNNFFLYQMVDVDMQVSLSASKSDVSSCYAAVCKRLTE